MNKYLITVFNYGIARAVIVTGYDINYAMNKSGFPYNEIIKVELIGAAEAQDLTN